MICPLQPVFYCLVEWTSFLNGQLLDTPLKSFANLALPKKANTGTMLNSFGLVLRLSSPAGGGYDLGVLDSYLECPVCPNRCTYRDSRFSSSGDMAPLELCCSTSMTATLCELTLLAWKSEQLPYGVVGFGTSLGLVHSLQVEVFRVDARRGDDELPLREINHVKKPND